MPRSTLLVTLGILLSMFLAAMEATVVATAMPTIVSQLGGLNIYSWVFSAYLVASTTMVPVVGKLSDVVGRRPVYAAAMALFLAGSLLCGRAASMAQLVSFRVVQGLGAGGVMTLASIIVGALFTYEQRARMQGIFAAVWGVSSIIGPLVGGFLVDQVSWRWVFYINLIPGPVALGLIWFVWTDDVRPRDQAAVPVDYLGSGVLTLGVVALLVGLFELRQPAGVPLLAAAGALFALLWRIERKAADPVLPLALFRDRLFAAASAHSLLSGCALFGAVAFVPLFVQAVLGTSATAAGATVTPIMLGWVAASVTGSRVLLRVNYRTPALIGMAALTLGAFLMTRIDTQASQAGLIVNLGLMGIGMGLSVPTFLIAVQAAVARSQLGTATSTLQFGRSIGGAVGVSVMGALLSLRLGQALRASAVDPGAVSLARLLDPLARSSAAASLDVIMRQALTDATRSVFIVALLTAVLALAATALAPGGRLAVLAARREQTAAAASAGVSAPPAATLMPGGHHD